MRVRVFVGPLDVNPLMKHGAFDRRTTFFFISLPPPPPVLPRCSRQFPLDNRIVARQSGFPLAACRRRRARRDDGIDRRSHRAKYTQIQFIVRKTWNRLNNVKCNVGARVVPGPVSHEPRGDVIIRAYAPGDRAYTVRDG